jgi:hypothetical protein
MGNNQEPYYGRMDGPAGPLFGGDAAVNGGAFTDRVIGEWSAANGDPTAGYRPEIPEGMLRHHADAPAIGCAAGAVTVELGAGMRVQVAA